jgi:methionyl aminopeptidase
MVPMSDPAAPTALPGRNDPCWCGSGRKYKRCHAGGERGARGHPAGETAPHPQRIAERIKPGRISPTREVPADIPRPPYVDNNGVPPQPRRPVAPQQPEVLARMRRAGRAAREVLEAVGAHVEPGVTTDELDAVVHEHALGLGAYPSPLGYHGFPKSVCTSVNEVICHGIPDDRPLAEGDIVNVDVTLYLDGVHGDTSTMFRVGEVDAEKKRLIVATEAALAAGIEAARAGAPLRDIGRAIQGVAEAERLGVVRTFVGHGIGTDFHAEPTVYHYDEPEATLRLEPGMTFTIEPMLNLGSWRHVLWEDGWTAVTADLQPSAQMEHTLLVTEDEPELLTATDATQPPRDRR